MGREVESVPKVKSACLEKGTGTYLHPMRRTSLDDGAALNPVGSGRGSAGMRSGSSAGSGGASSMSSAEDEVLQHVGFNQDAGCFTVATSGGFRVFHCEPFRELFRRSFPNEGGIGHVEMLFRCNILALIGGGAHPAFPAHKVMLWDDHARGVVGELAFRHDVVGVRLRRDRVVAVLSHKVYVYNFDDLTLVTQVETIGNPTGLCCLSTAPGAIVLACPGLREGDVHVEWHAPVARAITVNAHASAIVCLALASDGTCLATASAAGTVVRIFDTVSGATLHELRRGVDRARIHSLALSPDAAWVCCCSDKGTLHIFNISGGGPAMVAAETSAGEGWEEEERSHPPSSWGVGTALGSAAKLLPKALRLQRSFAQFRMQEDVRAVACFGATDPHTLLVLAYDGSFHKIRFDPKRGGDCSRESYYKFLHCGPPRLRPST